MTSKPWSSQDAPRPGEDGFRAYYGLPEDSVFVFLPEPLVKNFAASKTIYKQIKALGGVWCREPKGWSFPASKAEEGRKLLEETAANAPPPKPPLDPRLKEARLDIEAAQRVLAAVETRYDDLRAEIVLGMESPPQVERECDWCKGSGRRSPDNNLDDCNGCQGDGSYEVTPAAKDLAFGGWECETSPIGQCVYDDVSDHGHHHCLFCKEPRDRS